MLSFSNSSNTLATPNGTKMCYPGISNTRPGFRAPSKKKKFYGKAEWTVTVVRVHRMIVSEWKL